MKPKESAEAIVAGYQTGLEQRRQPLRSGGGSRWLRAIAESKLRDPVAFWQKMDRLPAFRSDVSESAREALEHMLPQPGIEYRLAHRIAGIGSLGRVRIVALAEWNGGR